MVFLDRQRADPYGDLPYQDPRWDDGLGPVPRWAPDSRKPWKPGQSKGMFVWPRDKNMKGTPLKSWQRWKDVFTGKGPAMYFANRRQFGPTRADWSNWINPAEVFDSLGYRDEHEFDRSAWDDDLRYDFRTRKYTTRWRRPEVWSDVKWGKKSSIPLYVRNGLGMEWTMRNGRIAPFDNTEYGNDFRYRGHTDHFDWARPQPWRAWDDLDV